MSRTPPLTPPSSPRRKNIQSALSFSTIKPISTPTANCLADSLGVSPLYRQHESARWQSAAQIYQSCQGSLTHSRAHSPVSEMLESSHHSVPSQTTVSEHIAATYNTFGTPLSLVEIGRANRKRHAENGGASNESNGVGGPLELEAIAAVHELSNEVRSIDVSDILPRTADLIFVNIKTVEGNPYTLELTMKGWRVASSQSDSMNGNYKQVELHTKYYENARQLLEEISPAHSQYFTKCLIEKLNLLHESDRPQDEPSCKIHEGMLSNENTVKNERYDAKADSGEYDSCDEGLVLNFGPAR